MKQLILLLFIILIGISSCVKDEDLKEPSVVNTDSSIFLNELVSTGAPDYTELYNSSDESVDLSSYVISDGGADYTIPEGTTIDAKGYLVLLCDDGDMVDEKGIHTNFKISSGGELIKIVDADGSLIDQIDLPPMSKGTAYGRTTDGGEVWGLIVPSPGRANSNTNIAPIIKSDSILSLDDNTILNLTATIVDLTGIREVKLFYSFNGMPFYVDMAPVGGNEYSYTLPLIPAGAELEYYIMAADETGLKAFFPESAPDAGLKVSVEDGSPILSNFNISTENPAADEEVTIQIDVFDVGGIDEVRLYWVIDDQAAADKEKIVMENIGGNTYEGKLMGYPNNTLVHYYIRGEDLAGNKSYYPLAEDFDNDIISMWPTYTVAPPTILEALVINEIQGGGSPDYIELYNGTGSDIDLGGYKLHDKDPTEAYVIPSGTIISAGGFWVLDCDGDAVTLFKVSSGGENITLLDPSDNVVDELLKDNWPAEHTGLVGRVPDGADKWSILDVESKGSSNN